MFNSGPKLPYARLKDVRVRVRVRVRVENRNLKFCTLVDVFDTKIFSKYLVLIMFSSGSKLPYARLKDVRVRVRVRVEI